MSEARANALRIGIDARFFNESGVGRYLRNLIYNLQKLDNKNEYFIFLLSKDYEQLTVHNNFTKIKADFTWYGFAEQFQLPKLLKKYKLDIIHFPHFNVPVFYSGKFVVTIHDLIHQHHAMKRATILNPFTFKIKQIGYKRVFKTAVTKSQRIFVPSKSVEDLLTDEWNINKDKIVITPEAVDDKILTTVARISTEKSKEILKKLKINPPYIFYIGNAHPHKNVEGLIKAFIKLKERYKNLRLVLSGYDHYFWEKIKKEYQNPSIIYTGFISDEILVTLYKNASCFVMPSLEEGFGIPILEAMACSCPVVSSNAGALPEVGGNAAIYFDPNSIEDMEDKIEKALKSKKLKEDLIEKGRKRVKLFSWKRLAEQTLEVYKECV